MTCAISGSCPESVLDAAHLYSYAELGQHQRHGGLLLRSDLHRLFDRGLIAAEPDGLRVDVDESVRVFEPYGRLHGQPLRVEVPRAAGAWLEHHWLEYR